MNSRGQVLVGVIVVMLIMAIIVPVMILYTQNEARWSEKNRQSVSAFQLAEAGVDRGFRKISESTTTWEAGQNAVFPTGYTGTQVYSDLAGGCYTISISSGPDEDQVTIYSTGVETRKKESRTIKAIYTNSPLGDTAIRAGANITVGGSNTQVHWGAIVTPENVTVNSRTFPQIWSAGSVDLDASGATPPNCDEPNCVQWHSYDTNIPPDPGIDTQYFYEKSVASGTYYPGNQCWGKNSGTGCGVSCALTCSNSTDCATGRTYYVDGNLCVEGKIFVLGTLFVRDNMTLPNGLAGEGSRSARVPRKAWMQYGNAWASYLTTWDSTKPTSFPGLSSGYLSPAGTYVTLDKVITEGFLYVGGNLSQTGGSGQTTVIGAAYVGGTVTVTPNNFFVYYSENAGQYVKTMNIYLSRASWQEEPSRKWSATLPCP